MSKKDFVLRIKIARKEAKETRFWLHLIDTMDKREFIRKRDELIQEATELTSIFGAIMRKAEA